MGSLKLPLPQGPNQHCGNAERHDMHMNEEPGTLKGSHCDGVPVLPSFVELTVRVPLEAWSMPEGTHEEVLEHLRIEGLNPIVEAIGEPGIAMVLRVRAGGKDEVYPLVKRDGGPILAVKP